MARNERSRWRSVNSRYTIDYSAPKSDRCERVLVRYGVSRNAPYLNTDNLGLLYCWGGMGV